jgi:hypothetical protein
MFFQQTRTLRLWRLEVGGWRLEVFQHRRQRFSVNHSRTQNPRRRHRQIEHGGLDANLRLAAVHDQSNLVAELLAHMFGIRWRNPPGQIRARGGERESAFANHRLHKRVPRPAHPDRCAARRDDAGNFLGARQHECQWPGPKCPRQYFRRARPRRCAAFCHFDARDMDNDRIVRRPAFDLENFCNGFFVESAGRQTIDRFRRQGHNFTGAQQFRRAFHSSSKECGRVRGQDFSGHTLFIAQGVNGVELRRFPGGIEAGDDTNDRAGNERDGDPGHRCDRRHVLEVSDRF